MLRRFIPDIDTSNEPSRGMLAGYSLSIKADIKRIMKKNEWKLVKICQVQYSTTKMILKKKKKEYLKNNYFDEFWTNKNSFK